MYVSVHLDLYENPKDETDVKVYKQQLHKCVLMVAAPP